MAQFTQTPTRYYAGVIFIDEMIDVWIIHPKLATSIEDVFESDRVDLGDLGLSERATEAEIKSACEHWFGGNWPRKPWGGTFLQSGDLADFNFSETNRSIDDNKIDKELIVYSIQLIKDEAELRISPYRAGKNPEMISK